MATLTQFKSQYWAATRAGAFEETDCNEEGQGNSEREKRSPPVLIFKTNLYAIENEPMESETVDVLGGKREKCWRDILEMQYLSGGMGLTGFWSISFDKVNGHRMEEGRCGGESMEILCSFLLVSILFSVKQEARSEWEGEEEIWGLQEKGKDGNSYLRECERKQERLPLKPSTWFCGFFQLHRYSSQETKSWI